MCLKMAAARKPSAASPYSRLVAELKVLCSQQCLVWSDGLQTDIPKRWEIHGDMVILPNSAFKQVLWRSIEAPRLWTCVCSALGCERLARRGKILDDAYRSPVVNLLFGENGIVQHKDNGIIYEYDVTKCMFSMGNIDEKLRVAGFNCQQETVLDMFAGIGYFTLPYLLHAGAKHVHACEWNPDAVEALNRNLELNNIQGGAGFCVLFSCLKASSVTIHQGDCRRLAPSQIADRVNMGILPSARGYLRAACNSLKTTGGAAAATRKMMALILRHQTEQMVRYQKMMTKFTVTNREKAKSGKKIAFCPAIHAFNCTNPWPQTNGEKWMRVTDFLRWNAAAMRPDS